MAAAPAAAERAKERAIGAHGRTLNCASGGWGYIRAGWSKSSRWSSFEFLRGGGESSLTKKHLSQVLLPAGVRARRGWCLATRSLDAPQQLRNNKQAGVRIASCWTQSSSMTTNGAPFQDREGGECLMGLALRDGISAATVSMCHHARSTVDRTTHSCLHCDQLRFRLSLRAARTADDLHSTVSFVIACLDKSHSRRVASCLSGITLATARGSRSARTATTTALEADPPDRSMDWIVGKMASSVGRSDARKSAFVGVNHRCSRVLHTPCLPSPSRSLRLDLGKVAFLLPSACHKTTLPLLAEVVAPEMGIRSCSSGAAIASSERVNANARAQCNPTPRSST